MTEVLAKEDIDNLYLYGPALDAHEKCLVVIHSTNDEHAIPKLNQMAAGTGTP